MTRTIAALDPLLLMNFCNVKFVPTGDNFLSTTDEDSSSHSMTISEIEAFYARVYDNSDVGSESETDTRERAGTESFASNSSDGSPNCTNVTIIPGLDRPLTEEEMIWGTNPDSILIMKLIVLDAAEPWVEIVHTAAAA